MNGEKHLIRELKEEVGIEVVDYNLFDANSITFEWIHKGELEKGHHLRIFYKILDYKNELLENINIDSKNDDSLGAQYYDINNLKRDQLFDIANMEILKLGYKLKN